MAWLLGAIFIASLFGSLHCVGMCGPFAMLASADAHRRRSAVGPAIAYSGGRLLTYSLVGLVFGTLGMALSQGTAAAGGWEFSQIQQVGTWIAGGLMILVGLIALARQLGWRVPLPSVAAPIQGWLSGWFKHIHSQPPNRKALLIGALTCLMPCGWLYTFAIVAAGTGSPWMGTLVMVVFWAGTVPVMSALMLGAGRLSAALGKQLPLAMATLVILVGVFTLAYRAPVSLGGENAAMFPALNQDANSATMGAVNSQNADTPPSLQTLTSHVSSVDHKKMPCCSEADE